LGYKYFVHFSGHRLFAYDMEKTELCGVMKLQFWPFVRSIACFVVLTQNRSCGFTFHPE